MYSQIWREIDWIVKMRERVNIDDSGRRYCILNILPLWVKAKLDFQTQHLSSPSTSTSSAYTSPRSTMYMYIHTHTHREEQTHDPFTHGPRRKACRVGKGNYNLKKKKRRGRKNIKDTNDAVSLLEILSPLFS